MDLFPYPPALAVSFGITVVVCFVVTGYALALDWMGRHDGPPSVRAQRLADEQADPGLETTLVDTLPVDASSETHVPIVAPAAAAMPRPPLPVRSPAARPRAFDPAEHEQALTEALFVAAQADSSPGITRLVPLHAVAQDSSFAPDVDEHIEQALAEGLSYREYAPAHRAVMS